MFEFAVIFVAVGIAVSLTVHGYFVKKKPFSSLDE